MSVFKARSLLALSSSLSVRPFSVSCTVHKGRNFYVAGGSNEFHIPEDVRDLIRNQRTAENIDEWRIEPGIQDPIVYEMKDPCDIDDDQTPPMLYWPHKGEKVNRDFKPSPVFLVKRVKSFRFQPYWHKETLERLGLGEHAPFDKVVVVPNMPSMNYKLFSVKHLIEIIPVTFPMGFPDDEEFDPRACRINHKGEFYYHPKLKIDKEKLEPQNQMKLSEEDIVSEARRHWNKPWASPLGNSNYHRFTGCTNPKKKDFRTDPTLVAKFSY